MECEYCKQILSTKYSLKNHQKKTKSCLEIQGKKTEDEFKCNFCNKVSTTKWNLDLHLQSCKQNKDYIQQKQIDDLKTTYEKQIQELKDEIHRLQDKLENIAIKSLNKTNYNNYKQYN